MHYKEAKSILSPRNGMNLYRGCTHGCIYCDSRSACYNMQHDFEDVEVKINAPALLEDALKRKRKKCMIGTGSMCDPYLPLERKLELTKTCFELVERYGFGLTMITKSDLILRDLELLKRINASAKCVVQMTLTTFDETLCRIVEPNVCTTKRRFDVLKLLRDNGIPTVVWLSPILPFLTDTEENLRGLLEYCREARVYGIICFGFGLTLRDGDREYFYKKIDERFPGLKEQYIRKYGNAYEILSDNNDALMRVFTETCDENGIVRGNERIFEYLHAFEQKNTQLSLF
ncbi:DNA repair photolyase [Sporobacter termitidis DSM 10068]|uniref:DNA repair photolyase n=1 Tax=Sporobacter termitidis DSM 10068 TaxID=1123282 RepID=A0A1M5W6E5_9FIRM|nr:radical SAM protein [Sporobacter termitidis]SHH83045.1 DNA repair photolyase [Sporobacter termitidis DSM 10068]